jgi:hypothetical protein
MKNNLACKIIRINTVVNARTSNKTHISIQASQFQLATPVVFTDHIQPICLSKDVEDLVRVNADVVVTGWGRTDG